MEGGAREAWGRMEKILILAKTYPSPSAQYVETSCVAGSSENGDVIDAKKSWGRRWEWL